MSQRLLKIEIPIEVELSTQASALLRTKDIVDAVAKILDSYEDGRYAFSSELVSHAVRELVTSGVESAVENCCREKFGTDMVEVGLGSSSARFLVEAEKIWKGAIKWIHIRPEGISFRKLEIRKKES